MASQSQFSDHLRNQLNDTNARNLELQAALAQREDALAACNRRLQDALSVTGDPKSILQNELRLAKEDASSAGNLLRQSYAMITQERSESKLRIEQLEHEVALRNSVLGEAQICLAAEVKKSTTVEGLQAELANTHAELKKAKQYASGIRKQFDAEKRENASRYPATAAGKNRADIDQDDEEVVDDVTRIKQETLSIARRQQSDTRTTSQPQERRPSSSEFQGFGPPVLPYRPVPNRVTKRWQDGFSTPPHRHRSRSKRSKRKRSSLESEDADYDDLAIDMDDSGGQGRKQFKALRGMEIDHIQKTLDFKAIIKYDDDGDKLYFDSKEDLADVCPDLWEKIQSQHEAWEKACGEEWRYDLESKYTVSSLAKEGARPPCVTTKLLKINNGKATWRTGYEGKFACLTCAMEKRPCFTWDGEELYLLPLHEKDKTFPDEDGVELRTWVDVE